MQSLKNIIFSLILVFSTSSLLEAKTFSSQFSEFELPSGWDCALEGSEWVCQSDDKDRKKEAIIILAAKYRGEQDSLDQYQAYLKLPKSFTLPGGKTQISEAKTVTVKTINNQRWVDALHLASEVPGFYTRYLATVKDNLGIAVTFSVAKDHYDAYQDIFEKVIATLKVFDQKSTDAGNWKKKQAEGDLVDSTTIVDTGTKADINVQKKGSGSDSSGTTDSILLIVGLCAVGFVIMKMRKKKK
ncbi:MAG: hypothetical protein Q7U04_09015 [Bacteriovorax sp.]|nr:hypothetical protein [Bacteriovorax sp.]